VVLGISFGMGGWAKVWPLFGAANQLLAGLALLAVAAWLKGKAPGVISWPVSPGRMTVPLTLEYVPSGKIPSSAVPSGGHPIQSPAGAGEGERAFLLSSRFIPVLTGCPCSSTTICSKAELRRTE